MIVAKKLTFSQVQFDNLSMREVVDYIGSAKLTGVHIVVTPNVDHISRINSDKTGKLLEIYNQAELCLLDSKVLKAVGSLIGRELPNAITGSDLTEYLFDHRLSNTDKIAVIGCNDNDFAKFREKYNHLSVYHYNPIMGFINYQDEVSKCINFVESSRPRYLFLAVGSPQQELLANSIKEELKSVNVVILCIGASINFLTGKERRAPEFIRKLHLEWLYRMMSSPRRLAPRYASNLLSLIYMICCEINRKNGSKKNI